MKTNLSGPSLQLYQQYLGPSYYRGELEQAKGMSFALKETMDLYDNIGKAGNQLLLPVHAFLCISKRFNSKESYCP